MFWGCTPKCKFTCDMNAKRRARPAIVPVTPPKGPPCTKCGYSMLLKRNREDKSLFWGCTLYPDCKLTQAFLGRDQILQFADESSSSAASSASESEWTDDVVEMHLFQYQQHRAKGLSINEALAKVLSLLTATSEIQAFMAACYRAEENQ